MSKDHDRRKLITQWRDQLAAKLSPSDVERLDQLLDLTATAASESPAPPPSAARDERLWFESLLNRLPIALALVEPGTGKIRFSNRAMQAIVGTPLVGTLPNDRASSPFIPKDKQGRPLTADEIPSMRAARGEVVQREVIRLRSPQGDFDLAISTDTNPAQHGHDATAILLLNDVTQERRYEHALSTGAERYRLATLATREAIWDWDLTTDAVEWNDALRTELGHRDEDLKSSGAWWSSHIHADDAKRVIDGIHALIAGTDSHWSDEYRFRRGDGTYAIVRDRGYIQRDGTGRGVRMIGAMQDVTREQESAARLRRSEADFRLLAAAIPQMLFVADLDGAITYFNERWYEYTGHPKGTTEEWGWRQHPIHHPDDLQRTLEAWQRSLRTGEPYEIEYRLRRHDGAYRWHLGRAVLMHDSDGRPVKWFGTNTDIHDQKHLAAQLEVAVSAARLGFWEWHIGDSVCNWSEQLREHYGFPPGQLRGRLSEVFERIHPDDRQRVQAALAATIDDQAPYHIEFRVMPEATTVRWLECQGACHVDETGSMRMTGTSLDITARKVAVQQLEAAKEAAEGANRLKSAFLANMSHEIRTPLGAVLGYSELLRDRTTSAEDRDRFVEIIRRAGASLTSVIDDILDLSKVEAGKLTTEAVRFDVRTTLQDVIELFRQRALAKGVALSAAIDAKVPVSVVSDPHRVRQILVNLVGNAVKFTDAGSIQIAATAEDVEGETFVELEVADTGVGVPAERRSQLFQMFSQADDSATRRHGGTGLGLALSRRLALALGGNVWLVERQSQSGGATFAFRFLASGTPTDIAPATAARVASETASLDNVNVLLAEDAPDNQLLVRRCLRRQGASVDVVANGSEAVDKALSGAYDLILMDIQMPVLDGYSATRALRAAGYAKPIVALTAHAMLEERQKSLAAGCNEHLTKPLNFATLISCVARWAKP